MSFSTRILDHFRSPRFAGELAGASGVGEASNPACGDVLRVWIRTDQDRVVEASFMAEGCAPVIACGSWLAERVRGALVSEIASLGPGDVEAGLDGLPPASSHAARLAVEALRGALEAARRAPQSQPPRPTSARRGGD